MAEVHVSICSPVDEHDDPNVALEDLLGGYHEGTPVEEARFVPPGDGDADCCTALHVAGAGHRY